MLTRTRSLFAVSLLAALIAPRVADACSPPLGFFIERAWPNDAAVGVPTDGAIVIVGQGAWDAVVDVAVFAGDEPVAGVVTQLGDYRYLWRAAAPLAADTVHSVHISSPDPDFVEEEFSSLDLSFTTGAGPAAPPEPGAVLSAVGEAWEKTLQHCAVEEDSGSCGFCDEWVIDGVEARMRLAVEAVPAGPFDGAYRGQIAVAPSIEALAEPTTPTWQSELGGSLTWQIDLGLAGTWPSDQACFRILWADPVDQILIDQASCVDVSAINVEPPPGEDTGEEPGTTGEEPETSGEEPTTGEEPETSGTPPETSSDSDSEGSDTDDPGQDVEIGCGCRSDAGAGWSGLLALLGLGAIRPRRRR